MNRYLQERGVPEYDCSKGPLSYPLEEFGLLLRSEANKALNGLGILFVMTTVYAEFMNYILFSKKIRKEHQHSQ